MTRRGLFAAVSAAFAAARAPKLPRVPTGHRSHRDLYDPEAQLAEFARMNKAYDELGVILDCDFDPRGTQKISAALRVPAEIVAADFASCDYRGHMRLSRTHAIIADTTAHSIKMQLWI